jgi:hypothetical protein
MISSPLAASTIRMARVTHVHPEGQKMEVIFLDTGDYGRDVQLMTPYGGTDFGLTTGVPAPEEEGHDPNTEPWDPNVRHINCVVATCGGIHICLGFLYPQCTHMAFTKGQDKNRLIERHTSDFVRTISDAGDMDMVHPAGAFLRIGNGTKPDNLAGRDFDGVWQIKHNTGGAVTITLSNSSGNGGGKTSMAMTPEGNIEINTSHDVTIVSERDVKVLGYAHVDIKSFGAANLEATGDCAVKAGSKLYLTAGEQIRLTAPNIKVCSDFPRTSTPWVIEGC